MAKGTGKHFYGWYSFSAAVFTQLVIVGLFVYTYGVFLPVMCDDLGWSRTVISLGVTVGYACSGAVSPLVGFCIARFGPKINILLGSLVFSLCMVGMSQVNQIWQVILLWGLAGLSSGFATFIATAAVGSNWFIKKRSLAMGILSGSVGIGGFVIPILATSFIASIGWRTAWLALAGVGILGMLVALFVRNKPEDIGQVPDGTVIAPDQERMKSPGVRPGPSKWTVKQALQQRSTWLIYVFMVANFVAWAAMMAHQVAYVKGLGATPMVAALTMSVVPGASLIGGVGCGILVLKFGTKRLAIASFAIYTLALVILLLAKSVPFVYVYAFLFGMSGGAALGVYPTLLADYYGRGIFPKVLGLLNLFIFPFRALSATVAGAIYDSTGTYTLAFIILIVLNFIGLICTLLISTPKIAEPAEKPIAHPV
jgi:MFS family permease